MNCKILLISGFVSVVLIPNVSFAGVYVFGGNFRLSSYGEDCPNSSVVFVSRSPDADRNITINSFDFRGFLSYALPLDFSLNAKRWSFIGTLNSDFASCAGFVSIETPQSKFSVFISAGKLALVAPLSDLEGRNITDYNYDDATRVLEIKYGRGQGISHQ